MVNFGERLAYWYLRLNGFLVVENFVLHGTTGGPHAADADLLAVRLMHSSESIDGVVLGSDNLLRAKLGGFGRNVALVVQVKTGTNRRAGAAFCEDRLRRCVEFIGVAADATTLVAELRTNAISNAVAGWSVAKLLVAEAPNDQICIGVSLAHAIQFIELRLASFGDRKAADRLFFPDELMQFLAWRAGSVEPR